MYVRDTHKTYARDSHDLRYAIILFSYETL